MRRKPVSEWTMDELKEILKRVRMALGEEDYKVMNAVVETLSYLTHLAKDKQAAEIYIAATKDKADYDRLSDGKNLPWQPVANADYDKTIELVKFVDELRKKKS